MPVFRLRWNMGILSYRRDITHNACNKVWKITYVYCKIPLFAIPYDYVQNTINFRRERMKIQELKELMKDSDRGSLEKTLAEVYKALPKSKKDDLDLTIAALLRGEQKQKKVPQTIEFETLKKEIEFFIENAYAQNYFAPNRVIHKSERPKWRFIMKNYIKELGKIPADSPNNAEAAVLLKKLYGVLCTACNYYLFSTDAPFNSVGIAQLDLCQMVIAKVFSNGYTRENIRDILLMVTTGGLAQDTVHEELMCTMLGGLKTSDVKYMVIEEAKKLIEEREKKLNPRARYSSEQYNLIECINHLCQMVLMTGVSLCEAEPEVEYYFKHVHEREPEVALYTALHAIDYVEDDKMWLWTYEYAVKKKIKPREWLQKQYAERKEK